MHLHSCLSLISLCYQYNPYTGIQEYRKIQTRNNSVFGHFLRSSMYSLLSYTLQLFKLALEQLGRIPGKSVKAKKKLLV